MRHTGVLAALAFSTLSSLALANDSFRDQVRGAMAADQQDATIAEFVKAASTATEEGSLLRFIWPATLQAFGVDGWKNYLRTKIIPYFAGAGSLDGYQGLASM